MSEKIPKYPVGSLVQHRASGQRALIIHVEAIGDPYVSHHRYHLEYGINKTTVIYSDMMDLRFLPVDNNLWLTYYQQASAAPSPSEPAPAAPLEAAPLPPA